MASVYKIIGNRTNQFYIGSSTDANKRFRQHEKMLRNGTHPNKPMSAYFSLYGFDFSLVILSDGLSREEAYDLENEYLQANKTEEKMFNVSCNSRFGDTTSRQPDKQEYIKKRTNAQMLNLSKLTKEERNIKWGRIGQTNPNYRHGRYMPTVCPVCGVSITPGAKFCPHHVAHNGAKNAFYGKHHTEEFKKRASLMRKGKFYNPSNAKPCEIDGKKYDNYAAAHRALGIPVVTIRWRCLSKHFTNYKLLDNE